MKPTYLIAALSAALFIAGTPAMAARTLYTIQGTGSGSLGGVTYTNSNYVFSFTADDRSNMPTANYFQFGNGNRVTLNIMTAFGTAFDRFYVQNLSSRFMNDIFDFTLPNAQLDIYAPFSAVTGTNVTAIGGFRDIDTTGGALTLSSSTNVRFMGVNAIADAVPEPASWALMLGGVGIMGFALRRKTKVGTTVKFA